MVGLLAGYSSMIWSGEEGVDIEVTLALGVGVLRRRALRKW